MHRRDAPIPISRLGRDGVTDTTTSKEPAELPDVADRRVAAYAPFLAGDGAGSSAG
jgi:hypothetical protein